MIVNLGDLDGGTLATQQFAELLGKPYLLVPVDSRPSEQTVANLVAWLRDNDIKTLNVAGPRESKRPRIYRLTTELLNSAQDRCITRF